MKEATLFERLEKNCVRCNLCAHHCVIADGKRGVCQVRENRDGTLYTLVYGRNIAEHIDPIEKKPLFHFYHGSTAYSIATPDCNFRCQSAAYTYTEPTIFFEYAYDTARLAAFSSRIGTWLRGARGSMVGIFLGALIIIIIENALVLVRLPYEWTYMAFGLVILFSILLDLFIEKQVQRARAT